MPGSKVHRSVWVQSWVHAIRLRWPATARSKLDALGLRQRWQIRHRNLRKGCGRTASDLGSSPDEALDSFFKPLPFGSGKRGFRAARLPCLAPAFVGSKVTKLV